VYALMERAVKRDSRLQPPCTGQRRKPVGLGKQRDGIPFLPLIDDALAGAKWSLKRDALFQAGAAGARRHVECRSEIRERVKGIPFIDNWFCRSAHHSHLPALSMRASAACWLTFSSRA